MRVAARTGIRNNMYDEVDVSCSFPETQAIIKVLISITERK